MIKDHDTLTYEFVYSLLKPIFMQGENGQKEPVTELTLYAPSNEQFAYRLELKRLWKRCHYNHGLNYLNAVEKDKPKIENEKIDVLAMAKQKENDNLNLKQFSTDDNLEVSKDVTQEDIKLVFNTNFIQSLIFGCLTKAEIELMYKALKNLMLSGSCRIKDINMTTFHYSLLSCNDLDNILALYIKNFFL